MTNDDRARILVTARLLHATALLRWLAAALLVLSIAPRPSMIAIALGLVAIYYGIRVAFDAALFDDIAAERLTTEELDAALARVRPPDRSWSDPCRGARRLAILSAIFTVAQLAAVVDARWA